MPGSDKHLKATLRALLPAGLWACLQRARARVELAFDRRRAPVDSFSEVYRNNLWGRPEGSADAAFYSGPGSEAARTAAYEALVRDFAKRHGVRTIVDLGCGDFQVGGRILEGLDCSYVGVDVVPDLIAHNQRRFGSERIRFACMDISADDLPEGDLYLVREVLQHLSNASIARILARLDTRPFVLITESQLARPRRKNFDIPDGRRSRALFRSAVFLDAPPFSRQVELLLEGPGIRDTLIRTYLLRTPAHGAANTGGSGPAA